MDDYLNQNDVRQMSSSSSRMDSHSGPLSDMHVGSTDYMTYCDTLFDPAFDAMHAQYAMYTTPQASQTPQPAPLQAPLLYPSAMQHYQPDLVMLQSGATLQPSFNTPVYYHHPIQRSISHSPNLKRSYTADDGYRLGSSVPASTSMPAQYFDQQDHHRQRPIKIPRMRSEPTSATSPLIIPSGHPPPTSVARPPDAKAKPQCWEHGCNGREFSTFSNLLRHQREKSGTATKSYCPRCGAEFTRTTARNGHVAEEKCVPKKDPRSAYSTTTSTTAEPK